MTVRLVPGTGRQVLFMPFHFREAAANLLTNTALDPVAKIPELKVCACQIEPIATQAAEEAEEARECPAKLAELDRFLALHRGSGNMVIPALQHAQALFDYVPRAAIERIAVTLGVPQAKVYGVATFYAQFRLQPAGRSTVKVCTGTACHVRGAETVLRAWSEALGIKPGQTTPDGAVTLEKVACLGACGLAPAAMVDSRTHGRLTPAKVRQVLATIEPKS